MQLKCFNYLG